MECQHNTINNWRILVSAANQTPYGCPSIKIETAKLLGLALRKSKYPNSKLSDQRRQARDAELGKEPERNLANKDRRESGNSLSQWQKG